MKPSSAWWASPTLLWASTQVGNGALQAVGGTLVYALVAWILFNLFVGKKQSPVDLAKDAVQFRTPVLAQAVAPKVAN